MPVKYHTTHRRHPMTYFIRLAVDSCRKGNNRDLGMKMDEPFLDNLWASQKGRCAYTNRPMYRPTVPVTGGRNFTFPKGINMAYAASIDRIDSSQGYIPGNVHFVCRFINLGKQDLSDAQVREFIADVVANWSVPVDDMTGLERNLES